jgi:hypothetical protein
MALYFVQQVLLLVTLTGMLLTGFWLNRCVRNLTRAVENLNSALSSQMASINVLDYRLDRLERMRL